MPYRLYGEATSATRTKRGSKFAGWSTASGGDDDEIVEFHQFPCNLPVFWCNCKWVTVIRLLSVLSALNETMSDHQVTSHWPPSTPTYCETFNFFFIGIFVCLSRSVVRPNKYIKWLAEITLIWNLFLASNVWGAAIRQRHQYLSHQRERLAAWEITKSRSILHSTDRREVRRVYLFIFSYVSLLRAILSIFRHSRRCVASLKRQIINLNHDYYFDSAKWME